MGRGTKRPRRRLLWTRGRARVAGFCLALGHGQAGLGTQKEVHKMKRKKSLFEGSLFLSSI